MKGKLRIIAMVITMAITVSICTPLAQAYHLTGNNAIDNGSSIVEAYILNSGELYSAAVDNGKADVLGHAINAYNLANGDVDSVVESVCDDVFGSVFLGKYSVLYNTTKLAILAYCDYFTACKNLGAAKEAEYASSINTFFTININGCLRLIEAVKTSTIQYGNTISRETLDGCQRLVDDMSNDVGKLRSKSFNRRFRSHKAESASYADTLESLIQLIDFNEIYANCWKYRNEHYYAYFDPCYTNSGSACVSMVLRAKGITNVSQNDIYSVGGQTFNWVAAEAHYNLSDNGSYLYLNNVSVDEKKNRILNSMKNTTTPVVIRLSPISEDNYISYILAVYVGGEIRFVDPFSKTGTLDSAEEYSYRNGYSCDKFWDRMSCCWGYV